MGLTHFFQEQSVLALVDALEQNDGVQKVFHTLE